MFNIFTCTDIPNDTLAAHRPEALRFYMAPVFRSRKAAKAALAMAILTARSSDISSSERLNAAATLRGLKVRFAVRLTGDDLAATAHEVILASDQHALWQLCDTNATFRTVMKDGEYTKDVFALDKRTKRVETWSTRKIWGGVEAAFINIDEQRI